MRSMLTLLTAAVVMALLVTPGSAAKLSGYDHAGWCSVGDTETGPAVALSLDCSHFDEDTGVSVAVGIHASANDVYGDGSFYLRIDNPCDSFCEERIFVDSFAQLQAQARGYLLIAATSPSVDLAYSILCDGVNEFGMPCGISLSIDGQEHTTDFSDILTFENVETNRPIPYNLFVSTIADVECCDWESKDFTGGFSYDLRNPVIRDHASGEILGSAEVRIPVIVPEPATASSLGIGLIGLAVLVQARRRSC